MHSVCCSLLLVGRKNRPSRKCCSGGSEERPVASDLTMMLRIVCLFSAVARAVAWGSDSSSDTSMYGNSLSRDWLYEASSMSIQVEGCMYGFVEDGEDLGCLADSSEDGTTYWYQMANCRRPQVVYSVYASGGNNANCNSGNFKESVRFSLQQRVSANHLGSKPRTDPSRSLSRPMDCKSSFTTVPFTMRIVRSP